MCRSQEINVFLICWKENQEKLLTQSMKDECQTLLIESCL